MGLLDYGSGNLHSAARAFQNAGADVIVSADHGDLLTCDGLLVPGVGAFAACMAGLRAVGGVDLIRYAKARGVKITCETAPHYLAGTDDMCGTYNSNTKVNPPLRLTSDQEALIEGLCDGTIDCIATDHAPHHRDEKEVEYNIALSGISGFETAFALCMEALVHSGKMTMEQFVKVACTTPANIIKKNCGELAVGKDADFAIVDPSEEWCIDAKKFLSKGKNTPFHGRMVHGRVKETYVGGKCIYKD